MPKTKVLAGTLGAALSQLIQAGVNGGSSIPVIPENVGIAMTIFLTFLFGYLIPESWGEAVVNALEKK